MIKDITRGRKTYSFFRQLPVKANGPCPGCVLVDVFDNRPKWRDQDRLFFATDRCESFWESSAAWVPFLGPGRLGTDPLNYNTASFERYVPGYPNPTSASLEVDKGAWQLYISSSQMPVTGSVYANGAVFGEYVTTTGPNVDSFDIVMAVQLTTMFSSGSAIGIGVLDTNLDIVRALTVSLNESGTLGMDVVDLDVNFENAVGGPILNIFSVSPPSLGWSRHVWLRFEHQLEDNPVRSGGDYWSTSTDNGSTWSVIPIYSGSFVLDSNTQRVLGVWGQGPDPREPVNARILSLDWPPAVLP